MLVFDNLTRLFFILVALFAVHASAAPRLDGTPAKRTYLTNAARMQAGLGPLKPRNLYSPSRIGARTPTTSIAPIGGNIKVVRKSNRATVGYVSKNPGSNGFGVTTSSSSSNRLSVTFTPTSADFNIAISGNSYPYLGFAGGTLGNSDSFSLVATYPTTPGARSQTVGNTLSGPSESSIWSFDSGSRALTAQWINSSGPRPDTYFWYYPSSNRIAIIRNPNQQSSGYEVLLYVV